MTELKNCYVIDDLENIGRYAGLSENFKTACEFVAKGAFDALAEGRNAIAGDNVFVNNAKPQYVLPIDRRPEIHHRYFDIHVPLACDEKIGLAVFDALATGSYDESDDCGFVDQDVEWFVVKKGQFCITWPITCVHAPAVTTDDVKAGAKLIVKVRA